MATQPRQPPAADLADSSVDDLLVEGYELVDGELVPVSPANFQHSRLMLELGSLLNAHAKQQDLGVVFVDGWVRLRLPSDPRRVRAPDVGFVSKEKLAALGGPPQGALGVAPDLAVEIFSATNERKARGFEQRIRDYLDAGVPLLWVIYPAARYAVIYHPDGSARMIREHESLDGEDVLPGFSMPLGALLEETDTERSQPR